MSAGGSLGRTISGLLFGTVLVILATALFVVILLVDSPSSPFNALLTIGTVALLFALAAYFLQAVVSRPILARASSWGFLAMGFTVIFVTIGVYPDPGATTLSRIYVGSAYLVVLAVALYGLYWRTGELASEARRKEQRQAWQNQPPVSAFGYVAAQPPGLPPSGAVNAPAIAPPEK